jgi:MarR family transcriptional regulator, temperature-dependent positive regulator of motility
MAKDKSGGKGRSELDGSPSHLLHRALQLALDIYADEFGVGGLTQRQYVVLVAVASKEGLTQSDLVSITGIDRSTLADMVARMTTKGTLERQKSAADARANTVTLTDAGRATLAEARPKMAAADARLLKRLSSGKRQDLTNLLHSLVATGGKTPKPDRLKKDKATKAAKKKTKKSD